MKIIYKGKELSYDKPCTVAQILKHFKLLPESVLVVRDGKLLTEDQHIPVDAELKIVSVISGG